MLKFLLFSVRINRCNSGHTFDGECPKHNIFLWHETEQFSKVLNLALLAVNQNLAGLRPVVSFAGQCSQERGFTSARWTHHGSNSTVLDISRDTSKYFDLLAAL